MFFKTKGRSISILFILVSCLSIIIFGQGCIKRKSDEGKIILKYINWEAGEGMKVMQKTIDDFEKLNPEIKIDMEFVPYGQYTSKVLTMNAAGSQLDIFNIYMNSGQLPMYIEKSIVYPLSDFIKNDKSFNVKMFYPALIKPLTFNKILYGLPVDGNPLVLFYNKDIFDSAGLAYPDETWDWNKMLEVSKELTKDANGDGIIDQYGCDTIGNKEAYIWQNNARLFSADKKKCLIETPPVVEAIKYLVDFRLKHNAAVSLATRKEQGGKEGFFTGRIAMYPNIPYLIPEMKKYPALKWGITVLPKGKARVSYLLETGYFISAACENKEAAWKFLKYMAGVPGSRSFAKLTRSIPSVISVAHDKNYYIMPDEQLKVLDKAMRTAKAPESFIGRSEFNECFNRVLDAMMLGETSIEKGVKEIQEGFKKIRLETARSKEVL